MHESNCWRPVRFLLVALVFATVAADAAADKGITILMPFAPGSSTDVVARDFGQVLSTVFRQPVVVDNRVGAEGLIAGQALVNAPADGHTMLFTSSSLPVLDPLMRKNLPYDAVKDFAPVCAVARITNVMNVTGSSRWRTVADVVAAAKAQPGKLTFAYTSATTRLAGELFQQATGVKFTGVPYKSSVGALTDVSGGQVDLIFIDPVTAAPFYQSQKVRPLVVAGARRLKSLPEVPSATETGLPAYSMNVWFGLFANAATPPAVLARMRESVALALKAPQTAALLEKRDLDAMPVCGDDLARLRSEEIEFWRGVIRKAGIEPQ